MTLGTSVIFRSTDVGAPQFSVTPGTLNTVLKAVLVDGYDTKASLGWTLEYEDVDAKVCVYRMKGGTRMFIRVDDSGISPSTTDMSHVTAYTSMINAHSGTERTPNPLNNRDVYVHKRFNAGIANVPWMVIGDDAGFYLITRPGYSSYPTSVQGLINQVHYFGDYIKYNQKNMWNFCLMGMSTTTYTGVEFSANTVITVQRDALFMRSTAMGTLQGIGVANFGYNYAVGLPLQSSYTMGALIEYPIRLYDSQNVALLGVLPGVSDILQKQPVVTYTYNPNTVPYWEHTDFDGVLKMLLTSGPVQYYTSHTTNRTIFRVGRGFRDVR